MYTSFIMGDNVDVQKMFNIFYNHPPLSFVELFAIICDNNNPPSNQHDSTSNLEDLSDEYESCWVKTMVVILTPLLGPKEVTCLHPTKEYSNEIGNLGMIHVLVVVVFIEFVYSWVTR